MAGSNWKAAPVFAVLMFDSIDPWYFFPTKVKQHYGCSESYIRLFLTQYSNFNFILVCHHANYFFFSSKLNLFAGRARVYVSADDLKKTK